MAFLNPPRLAFYSERKTVSLLPMPSAIETLDFLEVVIFMIHLPGQDFKYKSPKAWGGMAKKNDGES
jgi:hypothetical protein